MLALTYPPYLREKARQLRVSKELTIDEIAERLGISRTTAYAWVGELEIPRTARQTAAQRRAARAQRRRYRILREEAYEEGRASFANMMLEPTFRDFVCLYLAEGYKRSRHSVATCNSDVAIMKLANHWICRLARNPVDYGLQYHADQDVRELVAYWGAELGIDPAAIRLQRKSNSNQLNGRTWRSRYGVLTARTGDTYFRARLQAWIDCLRETWD